jgi:asparagine synthase (glutamine-hydrolysing)
MPRSSVSDAAGIAAARGSSIERTVADILFVFRGHAEGSPSRAGKAWKRPENEGTDFPGLLEAPAGRNWQGFPCLRFECAGGPAMLLGEIYGVADSERSARAVVDSMAGASSLNGHFLLLAADAERRRLRAWTDRFGTVHAYHTCTDRGAALGTFFPSVSEMSSRTLDWEALAAFAAFGFFPGARAFYQDVSVLRPAHCYTFDVDGQIEGVERYWTWDLEPNGERGFDRTVEEFGEIFLPVMREHLASGRVAVPVSGGLDSRSTVAAVPRDRGDDDRLWSYSYGYGARSVENELGQRVADARQLPHTAIEVPQYLFDQMNLVMGAVEGFHDITQCRQASVASLLADRADRVVAAHWGDVWLDSALPENFADSRGARAEHLLGSFRKRGSGWLLRHVVEPNLSARDIDSLLRGLVEDAFSEVGEIADPDLHVKAAKTEMWSFRSTLPSLRMYQAGAFPRLPFYDTRVTDHLATVPADFLRGRRLQVEFIKRFAPDLAKVTWQGIDANLDWYRFFNTLLLPRRAAKKAWRFVTKQRPIERNWEIQFAGERGRAGLTRWLLEPGLKLHEMVDRRSVEGLIDRLDFQRPDAGVGYAVSMLLTLSSWLELHG